MQNQQERDLWLSWLRDLSDEKLSLLRLKLDQGYHDERDILPNSEHLTCGKM